MAVSQIEEKILGRLAEQTAPTNALLSASLYQVLGLSILLSRKLYRARKLRKLDGTRETKSLQLYHHIIWLAREGLSIVEVYILPYCQDGEQGAECRVMAAKLRASLYHVFCLFHNNPPLSGRLSSSESPPSRSNKPNQANDHSTELNSKRKGKAPLRDPIPSIQSDASFVTNPYAAGSSRTPPSIAVLPPDDARRTPSRPPGLAPIDIPALRSAAQFLLPPLNFVPMAKEHFETAQQLADSLLSVTHALRLSVALEHAAFLWDCAKEHERSRKLAKRTIRDVYTSSEGLDDDEFADASILVQSLGGLVKRGSNASTPQNASSHAPSPKDRPSPRNADAPPPPIDRTIAISPPTSRTSAPQQQPSASTSHHTSTIPRAIMRTPERLSTVPEADAESSEAAPTEGTRETLSPPISRLSSRSRQRRTSSITSAAASDKASKRKLVEQAEEQARQRQRSRSNASSSKQGSTIGNDVRNSTRADAPQKGPHSRQATPSEGYVRPQKSQQQQQSHSAGTAGSTNSKNGGNRKK